MENKKVSIKKVFYEVFQEPLFKRGFVLSKKYGCFMRLVDGEVLQYFMLVNDRANKKGWKAFYIKMGMMSLYTKIIEKYPLDFFGYRTYIVGRKLDVPYCSRYEYRPENDEEAVRRMKEALKEANMLFFPCIDSVQNLQDYVAFCKTYRLGILYDACKYAGDSLALIMADDHDDFKGILNERAQKMKEEFMHDDRIKIYEEEYERMKKCILGDGAGERDKVYADKELYAAAVEEANRRKEANLQILRDLKVID